MRFAVLWLTAVAVAVAAAAGACGGAAPPEPDAPTGRVRGAVDLDRPRAGAPDAGAAAGHGNDAAVAVAAGATFAFTGRVEPPGSTVEVAREGGRPGPVVVEPSGRFSAAVDGLRPGSNLLRLQATRPGQRPWRAEIRVTRAAKATVRVPEEDATPPIATLRVRPPSGAPAVLSVSPSAPGDRIVPITLDEATFRATGIARDDDGGTGRVRVTTRYETHCGDRIGRMADINPPAQIENIALAPGTDAPVERSRSVTVRLKVRRGCTAEGDVSSEATNAHGLQAVSRHVRFRYAR